VLLQATNNDSMMLVWCTSELSYYKQLFYSLPTELLCLTADLLYVHKADITNFFLRKIQAAVLDRLS
jgi:hypothetical protein